MGPALWSEGLHADCVNIILGKNDGYNISNRRVFEFTCSTCHRPFTLLLPDIAQLAMLQKCTEKNMNHNRSTFSKCKFCENIDIIYYCVKKHRVRNPD